MLLSRLVLFFLLSAVSAQECKEEKFYSSRERGFYWGKVCEEKDKKKVKVPWDELESLSWKEVRELIEEVRGQAVMNPTYENVREYKRLMAWVLKKGKEFEEMDRLVTLRESFTVSVSPYYRTQEDYLKELKQLKDKAGLVVFYSPRCPYCRKYKPVVEEFGRLTGWDVLFIRVGEKPEVAVRFGVREVPDTFVAIKEKEGVRFIRVGKGAWTLDRLMKNVLFVLRREE